MINGLIAASIVMLPVAIYIWWYCYGKAARVQRRSRRVMWSELELLLQAERRRRESGKEDGLEGQGV